jgi:hypothetical protein
MDQLAASFVPPAPLIVSFPPIPIKKSVPEVPTRELLRLLPVNVATSVLH